MGTIKRSLLLLAAVCFTLSLAACDRGPLEKGGKKVDDAVKDVTK